MVSRVVLLGRNWSDCAMTFLKVTVVPASSPELKYWDIQHRETGPDCFRTTYGIAHFSESLAGLLFQVLSATKPLSRLIRSTKYAKDLFCKSSNNSRCFFDGSTCGGWSILRFINFLSSKRIYDHTIIPYLGTCGLQSLD